MNLVRFSSKLTIVGVVKARLVKPLFSYYTRHLIQRGVIDIILQASYRGP